MALQSQQTNFLSPCFKKTATKTPVVTQCARKTVNKIYKYKFLSKRNMKYKKKKNMCKQYTLTGCCFQLDSGVLELWLLM